MKHHYLRVYLALQGRELEEDKFYLSQRACQDVGMEMTIEHWVNGSEKHAARFEDAYNQHEDEVVSYCTTSCVGPMNCPGFGKCEMPMDLVHKLLHD
ncbi:hypothetical protein COY27_00305 [Candidatus Woesearchaeota archaeon CG_4_10_14_0_2_um_filter_33_13]|nr:MAG: hypothetical protein COY27_00305 [Candidatus Woesearchaeota archaeon CG_4_10_14_0_2_um_filter_33_13]